MICVKELATHYAFFSHQFNYFFWRSNKSRSHLLAFICERKQKCFMYANIPTKKDWEVHRGSTFLFYYFSLFLPSSVSTFQAADCISVIKTPLSTNHQGRKFLTVITIKTQIDGRWHVNYNNGVEVSIQFFSFWLFLNPVFLAMFPVQGSSNDGWSSYSLNSFLNRLVIYVIGKINIQVHF